MTEAEVDGLDLSVYNDHAEWAREHLAHLYGRTGV